MPKNLLRSLIDLELLEPYDCFHPQHGL